MGDHADDVIFNGLDMWDRTDDTWKAFSPSKNTSIDIISLERETDKAWLIKIPTKTRGNLDIWFPKSQCSLKLKKKTLILPKWLFLEKNKETLKFPKL